MCIILISNEHCISHKLFAQNVLLLLRFDSVLWLDSFADGGLLGGGGSVPTLISSTLAAVRKTGTAGMSNSDRASGTTWALFQEWMWSSIASKYSLSIYQEWCPRLCLIVFVSRCDFSRFILLFFFFQYLKIKECPMAESIHPVTRRLQR